MKRNITIALYTDGSSKLLHGSEVPFDTQRKTVQGFRDTDVPEGVERVEIWTRGIPVKFACKKSAAALKVAAEKKALDEKIAADAARAAAEQAGK